MQPQPPPEMLSFGGSSSRMFDAGGGEQAAEAASPISSRPPATTGISFDELASIDHDQYHNQLGGSSSNRWPRQETLALLKIRSEMDAAFRDATLKGPLWDDVSRKLGELGYVRSAKKCKEKFENVHKYYKRTKEGRAARQDGKTYRFFTQLEAMQPPPATASTVAAPPPVIGMSSAGGVMQSGGSGRGQPFAVYSTTTTTGQVFSAQLPASAAAQTTGISFSSDSATSDSEDDIMSGEDQGEEGLDDRPASSNPKRKRSSSGSGSWKAAGKRGRMMDFFEGLMKKVMQKQEAMQQRLLETIEKREEDRLMREESWKQHEAARFSREQQLAAQERAMAASRDAAIVSFIHKITGQTIQLPPQPQPAAPAPMMTPASAPLQSWQHQSIQQPQTNTELVIRQQQVISQMPPPPRPPPVVSSEVIMAIPERQIPPPSSQAGQELLATSSGGEAGTSSSRWPKTEVLALIKLRSNLENQYQEAGPKGPLWEEISAGMQRMGYNRSSKRCKEKWENINKYFKKVKESNKKRPEDAKTCPYFNELDALYQRKKLVGGGSSSSTMIVQFQQQQYQFGMAGQEDSTTAAAPPPPGAQQQGSHVVLAAHIEPGTSEGASDGTHGQVQPHNNTGGSGKPEDTMTEQKQLDLGEEYSNNYQDNELCAEDEDIDEDDLCEKESKLGYKIDEFQRPPTNNKNGGTSSSSSSFNITMVQ